jgi:hypothetical protein
VASIGRCKPTWSLSLVVHQAPFGDFGQRQVVYELFADFMKDRATRFAEVRVWQLWNEMDVAFTEVFGAGHPEYPCAGEGSMRPTLNTTSSPFIRIEEKRTRASYARIYGHVLTESRDLGFDLVRPDGLPRPAYQWLKAWAHGR